ncbi:MAG: porin family protein [Rikenellaceae bacterium]
MKRILILIFAFFLTSASFAQSLSFGPRVGMNIAKLKGIEDSKLGLNVGVYANIYVNKVGIEVAGMFSQEGGSGEAIYDYDGSLFSSVTKLNYFNVPVVLKYKIIGNLNVFAGPQFGFLLSAKQKNGNTSSFNLKDKLKSSTVSGVAGVGYTFLGLLDVNLNYNFGFQNIVEDQTIVSGVESFASNIRGGTWQITFGLDF